MNLKSLSRFLIFLTLTIYPIQGLVFAQCASCTVNVGASGNPTISNNDIVCINANRSTALNLNNRTGLTVCIANGITMSGMLQNIGNPITIEVHGSNSSSLTLGSGSTLNVFGSQTGNITSNNGADINNSGTISGNITLNSSGAIFNNSGTLTGSLTMNSGSDVVNSGIFNLSGLTFNSGSVLTNSLSGEINVSTSVSINGLLGNEGNISITGNLTTNGGSQLDNSGNLSVSGSLTNNSLINSDSGAINIGGNLTNNGGGVLKISSGSVGGNATNNGTISINGEFSIDGNLTINGGSSISAADDLQPNYLLVGGTFSGAGCLNGTSGILFVNKFQSGGSCLNGEVFIGGNPGCLELIETPYVSGGEDFVERVYIFKCSTDWTIPDSSIPGEILIDAEVLIVAGGGGGGRGPSAGGGGAGGLLYFPSYSLSPGITIPVIVGVGGLGSTSASSRGANGGNSEFIADVAIGGGGGGSTNASARNGNNGGSGGGGAFVGGSPNGASGTGSQGNAGGNGNRTSPPGRNFGGGGGGADGNGGLGPDGSAQAGARGGNGRVFGISGTNVVYAAGGGGTSTGPGVSQGIGGSSGIGGTANASGNSRNGQNNTGSGGGATVSGAGGNGAAGVVIVKQSFRILPVDFLKFKGDFNDSNREVVLFWTTAKEWNNLHFEIERSTDNTRTWQIIGMVNGIGWSDIPQEYKFIDDKISISGGLIYYRLKQVDFSGTFSYSKTISVKSNTTSSNSGFTWRVYPNPVKGEKLTLESLDPSSNQDGEIYVTLINTSGSRLFTFSGRRNSISDLISDEIRKSKPGVYILEITEGRKVEYIKILKL